MRTLHNLLMSLAALCAFLVLGELAIRGLENGWIVYDLEMTRYANELKIDSANPDIGHVHRPGASTTLMGVPVQINAAGFRDDDYPLARSDKYRIIFLGDSLTFGWGVRKEETFESLLEKSLDAEIINFGTGNYNTAQEVSLFLEKGLAYQPDKVVLFYFINDAEPVPQKRAWGFLGHSHLITFYWSRLHTLLEKFNPSSSFTAYYRALYAPGKPGWQKTQAGFARLKNACSSRGIQLQVVLLPELHELQNYPFQKEYAAVGNVLSSLGIDFFDVTPAFSGEIHPERFWVARDDAHPNALAHERIAQSLTDFLKPQKSPLNHS